jgi:hypothetical protein
MKTLEEHRGFIFDAVRLMLAFSYKWSQKHGDEGLNTILVKRTLILNYSGLKDKEFCEKAKLSEGLWDAVYEKISRIYPEALHRKDESFFEAEAFEILKPLLLNYMEKSYQNDIAHPKGYAPGCSLRYEPKPIIEEHPNWCVFHIANAISPSSIFDDRDYLVRCFREIMDRSEKEAKYDTLYTFTWLNSYERWLVYFPEEWHRNMDQPDENVWDNLGYWGQIINARKTFNSRTGEYIRQKGELKYKPRRSNCLFSTMRNHLKSIV